MTALLLTFAFAMPVSAAPAPDCGVEIVCDTAKQAVRAD